MARKLFERQAVRRRSGALAAGVALVVYTDEAATVLADVSLTSGGSAIAGSTVTTANIAGLGPASLRFWGPTDGTDSLYLRTPSDTSLGIQKIEAATDPRLDALEAGGGGAHPDLAAHDTLGLVTDSILATHAADTTVIHGIADTTKIVVRELLTQATVDAKQAAGEALHLAAGTHTVASVITLRPVVRMLGEAADLSGAKGTLIVGTTGQDVFKIDGDAAPYGGYELENLKFSGGDNQLVVAGETATHVSLTNIEFGSPVECGVVVEEGAIEEWYFNHVIFQGGQYGFRKISGGDADFVNNYIDRSVWRNCIFGGQSKSGFWADTTIANSNTFDTCTFVLTGEHGFYWRGGPRGTVLVNMNTEQCGTTGKKNRTTLSGTVSAGATSGTLASATGWATADQITIAGAGAGGGDFEDTVTISGTTATWTTPTTVTVTDPKATNAKWDEFHFTPIPAVAGPAQVTFIDGILGSEATLGRLRYSIRLPGDYFQFLGVTGGTGNDVPAYVGTRRFTAAGGNLRVRTLGREFDTGNQSVIGGLAAAAPAANAVALQVRGYASQSSNLQEWVNDSGTTMSFMDQLGRFYQGAPVVFSLDHVNGALILDNSAKSAGTNRFTLMLPSAETASAVRVQDNIGVDLWRIGNRGQMMQREGTNAFMGSVALAAGSATVSTTAVSATSRIQLTSQADGGTPGFLRVSARTAGTSFVITSSSGADTSTVAWLILEPA